LPTSFAVKNKNMKIQNYINGHWIEGKGEGTPLFDSVTGEIIGHASTEGIDFAEVLHYGRTKGGEKLRKMTFTRKRKYVEKFGFST